MTKRAHLKPPGKCIFCGGGSLSKEHIWSEWTHALIGKTATGSRVEALYHATPYGTSFTKHEERPGHTAAKKIRVVCKPCNNGWMSSIEEVAKDYLTPLIMGQNATLDIIGQKVVASWIALKVFTIEHNTKENVIASQGDRDAFRAQRIIPKGMTIAIGRCGQKEWNSALFWETHTVAASDTLDVTKIERPAGPNIQAISFGIGELFINACHSTAPGVAVQTYPNKPLLQIFPTVSPVIRWPPSRALTAAEARHIATILGRMEEHPRFRWMP